MKLAHQIEASYISMIDIPLINSVAEMISIRKLLAMSRFTVRMSIICEFGSS